MLAEIEGILLPKVPWGEFSYDTILDCYESAIIMLERDDAGRLYLVWWNEADQDMEQFVGIPLTKTRLGAILSDAISPLNAMENPEDGYLLVVDIDLETGAAVRVVKTTAAALPQGTLPHRDATLKMPMPVSL
ncbi:MAG: hypothetical protein F4X64_16915 [Chloroflexi bacterium]|nr:hypothetical protein [Chloroflexota bacterium]